MRSSRPSRPSRPLALLAAAAVVGGVVPALVAPAPAHAAATDVQITEFAYSGSEFVEITNLGTAAVDLTGWSFDDSSRTAGSFGIGALGALAAGESAVISEATADAFRTEWDLPARIKVIGANTQNLGRSDEMNVYDAAGTLVDRLTYNDQAGLGPRTDLASAVAPGAAGLSATEATAWTLSATGDAEGSWTSVGGFRGSPGTSTLGGNPPGKPSSGTAPDPAAVRINEVESNGDTVGDWVELINTGTASIDLSGWQLRDSGATNPAVTLPAGTTLAAGEIRAFYTESPPPGFGLGVADSITLLRADGTTVVDSYSWTAHAATTYGRCPDGTGDLRTTTVATRGLPNACSPVRINEAYYPAGAEASWVELVNLAATPQDVAGWSLTPAGGTAVVLPTGATVPANGHLVVDAVTLGAPITLRDAGGAAIDTYAPTTTPQAGRSIGRCADGVGTFALTTAVTRGSANDCTKLTFAPWPGAQQVSTVDDVATFTQDASGVVFDPADPATVWVVQNKAGTLTKLRAQGTGYVPAPGWSPGRDPRYTDGTGNPDTEGITLGPDGAVYLASERNNAASGVSRNSVLRYEPDTSMSATDEWNLTSVLPATGANLGLEGVTFVPDAALTAGGLVDVSTSQPYDPARYPAHGTGLFVVAVEGTGRLYLLALDQTSGTSEAAHLVATADPQLFTDAGPAGVMDVSWDPERQRLWAVCDDSCHGTSVAMSLTGGVFTVAEAYARPTGMPDLNNEGLAIAPRSACVDGSKPVLWADDGDTDGHSLRAGTITCTAEPAPAAPVPTVAPRVTGPVVVGGLLRAADGRWTPTPATTTRQWLLDGRPIAGATGPTLAVQASYVGRRLSVRVTVALGTGESGEATSAPTPRVVPGSFATRGRPSVAGTPRVGRVLGVRIPALTPGAAVRHVQWLVDGRPVPGATGPRVRVLERWAGHRISVRVRFVRPGYETLRLTSPAVRVR